MRVLGRLGWTAILLLAFTAAVWGAEREYFKNLEVLLKLQDAPRVSFDNVGNSSGGTRWLVVQVSYTPEKPGSGTGFLDDVTLEGAVLVETTNPAGRPILALFTGKTRFWTMALDGRRREALFAIPPQLLNRYVPGGVRRMDVFLARVRLVAPGNVLLGEAYSTNRKLKDAQQTQALFARTTASGSSVLRVEGGLYSQEQTPWAMVDLDLRDPIRPESK